MNRILAGAIDVSEHDVIGARERRPEVVHQRGRPGKAVRLKRDDDPAVQRAGRFQHGGNLRRVMTVVVHQQDALRLPAHLETPLDTAKVVEPGRDPIERQTKLESDRNGRQRILQVVPSRHVQQQRPERDG